MQVIKDRGKTSFCEQKEAKKLRSTGSVHEKRPCPPAESFLLLFYKKEALASLSSSRSGLAFTTA
jgi:hypothetical protein